MAFGSSGQGPGEDSNEFAPLSEINVTPFIDVMLVLLIIFMVTAPMLASGVKVDLPKARTAKQLENQKPVVVTIAADGMVQVGAESVTTDNLVRAVRAALAGEDRVIQLKSDRSVNYGVVVGVLDTLAADGLTKVALVADRPSGQDAGRKVTPP